MIRSIILLAALFTAEAVFAQGALNKIPMYNESSRHAQEKLNNEVFDIFKYVQYPTEQAKKINKLFASIPDCESTWDKDPLPVYCEVRSGEKASFLELLQTNAMELDEIPVVVPEKALYYGLTKYYQWFFGHRDPAEFNRIRYSHFYNKYKETPFGSQLEQIMLFIWQDGQNVKGLPLTKWDGKRIYDTVEIAAAIGMKDPYKYLKEANLPVFYDQGTFLTEMERIHQEVKTRSEEKANAELLKGIKSVWWDFLLGSYYVKANSNKSFWMIQLLSGKYITEYETFFKNMRKNLAWEIFAVKPGTAWEQERVKALYDECVELAKNPDRKNLQDCSMFRRNAAGYGYYVLGNENAISGRVRTELIHPRVDCNGAIWPNQ